MKLFFRDTGIAVLFFISTYIVCLIWRSSFLSAVDVILQQYLALAVLFIVSVFLFLIESRWSWTKFAVFYFLNISVFILIGVAAVNGFENWFDLLFRDFLYEIVVKFFITIMSGCLLGYFLRKQFEVRKKQQLSEETI